MQLDGDGHKVATIPRAKENDRFVGSDWIMINPIDPFVELVTKAAEEDAPRIDVRSRVLASISASSTRSHTQQIAFRFLVVSMSLAFVAIAVVSLYDGNEPPLEMLTPFLSSLP